MPHERKAESQAHRSLLYLENDKSMRVRINYLNECKMHTKHDIKTQRRLCDMWRIISSLSSIWVNESYFRFSLHQRPNQMTWIATTSIFLNNLDIESQSFLRSVYHRDLTKISQDNAKGACRVAGHGTGTIWHCFPFALIPVKWNEMRCGFQKHFVHFRVKSNKVQSQNRNVFLILIVNVSVLFYCLKGVECEKQKIITSLSAQQSFRI